jgi:hypothetical protein
MTLKACKTQSPAVMALVVAMAGMMLPAISVMNQLRSLKQDCGYPRLISNFDLGSMPKIIARMFAVAATKSSVSPSSLSKAKTAGMDIAAPVAWTFSSRELRW